MRAWREDALTGIIAVAAVIVAISVAHREFTRPTVVAGRAPAPPSFVRDWKNLEAAGLLLGDKDAKVKILVFNDLECPFCRRFHEAVRVLQARGEYDIALVFLHYPLQTHRFAVTAAQAAECANERGKFGPFVDAVFAKQDSIGVKGWGAFAREAGVLDTGSFVRCVRSQSTHERITRGLALGRTIGVTGTPTVLVNGWRIGGPAADSLAHIVRDVLDERAPFIPPRIP